MQGKVGVIGLFGIGKQLCDGQTIKTKNVELLLEKYTNWSLCKVDTYLSRTNKVRLLCDTMKCLLTCQHVFLLVSVNGMNFYLPFLYCVNKVLRRHIYHYVIGSELLDMVEENENLIKYLNALDVNWFEYESGTAFLRTKGVRNAETLSNFKMIQPVNEVEQYTKEEYLFCTFSRVTEAKGITEAIETIKRINTQKKDTCIKLHIYGPLDPEYETIFNKMLEDNSNFVVYKGVADSAGSVEILKQYYALLFPTHWVGEGVPGTIIDAFAAGIPIIATDWHANKELIEHMKQGIIYPNDDMAILEDAVRWAIDHRDEMLYMREESRKQYCQYAPEHILDVILAKMEVSL